jgi:hypothetical protein
MCWGYHVADPQQVGDTMWQTPNKLGIPCGRPPTSWRYHVAGPQQVGDSSSPSVQAPKILSDLVRPIAQDDSGERLQKNFCIEA